MTDAEVEQTLKEAKAEKAQQLASERKRRAELKCKARKTVGWLALGFLAYVGLVAIGSFCVGSDKFEMGFSMSYFETFHPWALILVVAARAVDWGFRK